MSFVPEAVTNWAQAEPGVHAASAFQMQVGWILLTLGQFGR